MILKQYCFSKTISETLQNACTVCCFFFFCLLQVIHMVVAQLFKHPSTFSLCSVDELGTLKWTDLGELLLEHGEAFCWYLYNQQDVHLFMLNQSKQTAYSHCKTLSGVNSISMHLGWQVRTNTSSISKKSEREKKKNSFPFWFLFCIQSLEQPPRYPVRDPHAAWWWLCRQRPAKQGISVTVYYHRDDCMCKKRILPITALTP